MSVPPEEDKTQVQLDLYRGFEDSPLIDRIKQLELELKALKEFNRKKK